MTVALPHQALQSQPSVDESHWFGQFLQHAITELELLAVPALHQPTLLEHLTLSHPKYREGDLSDKSVPDMQYRAGCHETCGRHHPIRSLINISLPSHLLDQPCIF
jgi:hypothetical protein